MTPTDLGDKIKESLIPDGGLGLTPFYVWDSVGRVISLRAEAVGLEASGHSLLVGMAQDLAASGTGLPEFCVAGRWRAPAMTIRYTRSQAADRGAVARY